MFPGKIAMKKAAVAIPTSRRRCREIRLRPRAISTTPDARTMKSGVNGAHGGT